MTFFIDSDSVPKNLRSIILKAAVRKCAAAFFVADRPLKDVQQFIAEDTHRIRIENNDKSLKSKISMIVVDCGANSADDWIADNAFEGDICITHDIPLASRLLEKGCYVIDDRGGSYTKENINALMKNREVNATLRECGIFAEQQSKTSSSANTKLFADNFDRLLTERGIK